MQTYPGNPHAGQTLAPTLDQGRTPYGGHAQALSLPRAGAAGPVGRSRLSGPWGAGRTEVAIAGQRRRLTPTNPARTEPPLEVMIGHTKAASPTATTCVVAGDAIHALLCGAGHNLRLILHHLGRILRALRELLAAGARTDTIASQSD
jgi:transposase, IS5 family